MPSVFCFVPITTKSSEDRNEIFDIKDNFGDNFEKSLVVKLLIFKGSFLENKNVAKNILVDKARKNFVPKKNEKSSYSISNSLIHMDAESLNKKTVAALKALCKKMGVKCTGTKAQHIDALLMAEAAKEGVKEVKIPTKKPTKKSKSPARGRSKSPKKPVKKVVKKTKSPVRKSKSPKKPVKKVARKSKSPARGRSKSPKKPTKKTATKKMSPEFIIEIPTASPTKKKSPAAKQRESRKVPSDAEQFYEKMKKEFGVKKPSGKAKFIQDLKDVIKAVKDAGIQELVRDEDNVPEYEEILMLPKALGLKTYFKVSEKGEKDLEFILYRDEFIQSQISKKKSPKPAKKSPVKGRKSPAKSTKKTSTKKSPAKKAKTCVDKEDPLLCDEDQICSAPSGRCIKDTKVNRRGSKNDKAELLVDGRVIVGTVATITKLEQILGGTVTLPGAKKSPVKKAKSPARKSPSKKAKSPSRKKSPARKSPVKKVSPVKLRTSPKGKEEESPYVSPSSPKKSPVKKVGKKGLKKSPPKKSPQTLDDVERRLDELIEEGGNVSEIDILKAKLAKLKAAKKSPTKQTVKPKPGKVQMKEQEIYKTFTGCLSALSAE